MENRIRSWTISVPLTRGENDYALFYSVVDHRKPHSEIYLPTQQLQW